MDHIEAAARGAYMCSRSAGGKLIIVMRMRPFREYSCRKLYFSHMDYNQKSSAISFARVTVFTALYVEY